MGWRFEESGARRGREWGDSRSADWRLRPSAMRLRQLEKVLGVPQPRVSELINGQISRMTADLLAKYLYRLGREVPMATKASRKRAGAIVR